MSDKTFAEYGGKRYDLLTVREYLDVLDQAWGFYKEDPEAQQNRGRDVLAFRYATIAEGVYYIAGKRLNVEDLTVDHDALRKFALDLCGFEWVEAGDTDPSSDGGAEPDDESVEPPSADPTPAVPATG